MAARTFAFAAFFMLAACSGDTGPQGPAGPPGPPGPPPTVDASDAAEINAAITRVTIASPPVVEFTLADGNGTAITGLNAGAIGFKLAKLVPGTDGNNSRWQSYINEIEQPGVGPGSEAKLQAATENGSVGELIDNNDGSYRYSFGLDISNVTDPVPVSYQPTLTHRVTFEVRGLAAVINPHYDWRPSDGATSGLFTREIASMARCNDCHEQIAFHGGARFTMQDCVVCHNPGSADANSGNSLDMTELTHKLHRGKDLPSVIGGTDYCLYGRRDIQHCYGDVSYPQDIRNCSNCHNENDAETPDGASWYRNPTAESCGSCHDDVNFANGDNHDSGIPAANAECASCHASDPDSSLEVRQAHRMPLMERRDNYSFNILGIDFAGPATAPTVRFSVTDPANGDTPYDLATDPELTASSLRFYVAWNTVDYTNFGSGSSNGQPERSNLYDEGVLQASPNGDGSYSLGLTTVPVNTMGSGVVTFEGNVTTAEGRIPVTTAHRYFGITDDADNPLPRRAKVELARCNDCHALTTFHGSSRNDSMESCQVCHNANAARSGDPSLGPMDMKHFLHRKHAVDDIRYPQRTENCLACHTADGFYPVSSDSGVFSSSFDRGTLATDPTDNTRVSPNSATCSVCHESADAQAHMIANGAAFDACTETDGVTRERVDFCGPGGNKSGRLVLESCSVCHGPGRISDLALVHGLNP